MDNTFAIGAFDSGLGGLTVVKELRKALPYENIVYFGDTGRVPYGNKSESTIKKYAKEDAAFLLKHNVKLIIAACGTVSSLLINKPNNLPVPFFEMITPAANSAVKATKNNKIGVIGTYATIKSEAHKNKINEMSKNINVLGVACPMFVPLVENGIIDKNDIVLKEITARYLKPIKDYGCDTLIMGCTHYPVLEEVFNEYFNGKVTLINPGLMLANTIKNYLISNNLGTKNNTAGNISYFVSDRPDSFMKEAKILLGEETVGKITKIDIEK